MSMSRSALIAKGKQLENKLEIKDRKKRMKSYKKCFVGKECVKVIINLNFATDQQSAVEFGNKLLQNRIIEHVNGQQTFKNKDIFYRFIEGYSERQDSVSMLSLSGTSLYSNNSSRSSSRILRARGRHRTATSNMTVSNVSDLLQRTGVSFVRRMDVYFRVNKYMRQNRLADASNFLRDLLKYISSSATINWSVLEGPTTDNIDLNHITDATKEKFLQDTMGESKACWIDVKLLECKLELFYDYNDGDDKLVKECITKLMKILDALKRSLESKPQLNIQSYYYRFIECETRACLAYAIVKSNSKFGYAAYAGIALQHCRKAMKLNPFHSLSHAMYGYLLDRCLDKYEEARQYLEYAIQLNNYYDSVTPDNNNNNKLDMEEDKLMDLGYDKKKKKKKDKKRKDDDEKKDGEEKKTKDKSWHRFAYIHIWLATLLVNFEEEFREIEYKIEVELREQVQRKYKEMKEKEAAKKKRKLRKDTDGNNSNIIDDEREESGILSDADNLYPTDIEDDESDGGGGGGLRSRGSSMGSPAINRQSSSIYLVKQLSHAHAYHRQRESHIRQLKSHIRGDTMNDSVDVSNMTNIAISREPSEYAGDNLPNETPRHDAASPSFSQLSTTRNSQIENDGFQLYKPMDLQQQESQQVEEMIAERLADDTLTANIGNRFGSDFMKSMSTIPDKPDDHFLAALKLEPQNSKFHSVYGVFLIQQEKFEAAKPHFEKAIKYDPNNIVSLNNLGWILSLTRFSQYQEAKNYLTKACRLRATNASIQFNLARLLAHAFGREELQNAKRYYLAALTNDPQNSHIHFFYAIFLRFMMRDNESAKKHLKKSEDFLQSSIGSNKDGAGATDMTFEVNGYIEHAKILQHESKFKAANFLLKRAAKLDVTKRREIMQLLKTIQSEEKELNMLRQQQSRNSVKGQ